MEPEADPIGFWSEIKLEILRQYLQPYARIMGNQSWCRGFWYIDGFAGKGRHISETTGEVVKGSPLIALDTEPPFERLVFIDLDPAHLEWLRQKVSDRPEVTLVCGDANQAVLGILDQLPWESRKRAVCLLDPYGLHVEWGVVEKAGKQRTIDLFLNFPVVDVNRNALRGELDLVSPETRCRMTALWGDESWVDLCFAQPQRDLFGSEFRRKVRGYRPLKDAFRNRLKERAGFAAVPEPILMRNEQGGPLYYLFFATQRSNSAAPIVTDIFNAQRQRYAHLVE
jgi:three-Cys-motif partner protein